MLRALRTSLCSIALGMALHGTVFAGQTCEEIAPSPESARMAFSSANELLAALDKEQPQVALVARVGQDLSKYGLRYSHVGFVRKDPVTGNWRTMHLLNACGTAHSDLWQEGLANFFLDSPFTYESLLIIPSKEIQSSLMAKLSDRTQYLTLFSPNYNMLAYPFSTRYENSNQWVLEVLASALSEKIKMDTREKAQQWLKLMDYQPTTLKLGPATRLGGRMFRANIAFDDHPNERRFADKIDTVTVDSIAQFLQKTDPATRLVIVPAPKLDSLVN
ncbi:DUF2145 domain-containing protein [Paraherbaspirillum soli]|uniref:DUF2145 domain-containing protein n=1 Tax=Paraherbaspirillum soli TaxID=631222 RepID=A0ABW0MB42_9BURK